MTSYQEVNIVHDMAGNIVLDYEKDVTYIINDGEELHLQIIYPITQTQKQRTYPCIVYMMSTNEKKEEIYHNIPRLTQFAQRGFVIALMEKPSENATYEEQIYLLRSAVHYLNEHAETYNISPENMFIWRDGSHKDHLSNTNLKDSSAQQTEYRTDIKAIVCFGEKEQMKMICSQLNFTIPPILMLPCEENETSNLEFWTEDIFDIIEDYLINYIN